MLRQFVRSTNLPCLGLLGVNTRSRTQFSVRDSRLLFSTKTGDTNTKNNTPDISLCQVNNHPDFRLRQARAKFESNTKLGNISVGDEGISTTVYQNPIRKSDGTSSGAIAEDRLRQARRKALEASFADISLTKQQSQPGTIKKKRGRYSKVVKEHGVAISLMENPVRSNDGVSSGALAADRLRLARRKALESMATPASTQQTEHEFSEGGQINPPFRQTKGAPETNGEPDENVREQGLDFIALENPRRSSDGTSSGAQAADRLRLARRRALEGMKKPS